MFDCTSISKFGHLNDMKYYENKSGGNRNMRTDIMVDIETLGTKTGATIFQIAAASFDITTGEVKDTVNLTGDIAKYDTLAVDGSTLKWWLDTDADLLKTLLSGGTLTEKELLTSLLSWMYAQAPDNKDVYLWGNGILFDNVKISDLCAKHDVSYPIFYRNDRDVRTILELASLKSGLTEKELRASVQAENERKHDAFDDVMFQIRLVQKCYEIVMK